MHNAKAILTTRRAGGLFVLQSSVFRINEKLLNGEQGPALTKEKRIPFGTRFCSYFLTPGPVALSASSELSAVFEAPSTVPSAPIARPSGAFPPICIFPSALK